MAGGVDGLDRFGELLGDFAEHEEGAADVVLGKHGEEPVRVGRDAAGEPLPPVHAAGGEGLEPVLEVDGQGVFHRVAGEATDRWFLVKGGIIRDMSAKALMADLLELPASE